MSGIVENKTVKLQVPIILGSETVQEIVIRRPKARDLRGIADVQSMDGVLTILSLLSGLDPALIDGLDAADLPAISEVVSSFLSPSPAGTKP